MISARRVERDPFRTLAPAVWEPPAHEDVGMAERISGNAREGDTARRRHGEVASPSIAATIAARCAAVRLIAVAASIRRRATAPGVAPRYALASVSRSLPARGGSRPLVRLHEPVDFTQSSTFSALNVKELPSESRAETSPSGPRAKCRAVLRKRQRRVLIFGAQGADSFASASVVEVTVFALIQA